MPFLPITKEEMLDRGWDCADVVLVTGDAYVDHPSFGIAILSRVLEAPYEELVRVKGMSANAAVLVSFCGQLLQAYYKDKFATGMVLHTTEETGRFLLPYFLGRKNEAVALICLDNRCKVLNCSVIFEGSVNSTEINIRLVLQHALMHNATAVILAHNHPSGHALPGRTSIPPLPWPRP